MPLIDSNLPCLVEGCGSGRYSKRTGFCKKHYKAYQRGDLTTPPLEFKYVECKVSGCGALTTRQDYCITHYMQVVNNPNRTPSGPGAPHHCGVPDCRRPVTNVTRVLCNHHRSGATKSRELDRVDWLSCPIPLCHRHRSPRFQVCAMHRERARNYGLSANELIELIGDGACRACNRSDEPLAVHHDHHCCPNGSSCGDCVVAALCQNCNRGAGLVKDDAAALHALADIIGSGPWRKRSRG